MQGLTVRVLRTPGDDFTLDGISSKFDKFVLVGPDVPEIFSPREDCPPLLLEKHCGFWRAIPATEPQGTSWMFGGNFITCSDSRFPNPYPIPVHDRSEGARSRPRVGAHPFGSLVLMNGAFRLSEDTEEVYNCERFPDGIAELNKVVGKVMDDAGDAGVTVHVYSNPSFVVEADGFNEGVTWRLLTEEETAQVCWKVKATATSVDSGVLYVPLSKAARAEDAESAALSAVCKEGLSSFEEHNDDGQTEVECTGLVLRS